MSGAHRIGQTLCPSSSVRKVLSSVSCILEPVSLRLPWPALLSVVHGLWTATYTARQGDEGNPPGMRGNCDRLRVLPCLRCQGNRLYPAGEGTMSWWVIFLCYRGYLPRLLCRWLIWPAALVLPFSPSEGAHGHWIDHYFDASGVQCCAVGSDCVALPTRILAQTSEQATVEIDGQSYQIPQHSLHLSEDTHDWVCWTRGGWGAAPVQQPRCIFIAPGT